MISQVYYKNFKGLTERWDLEGMNAISGDNGVGKSTIAHAIQLLLLGEVPSHNVNNTVADQFKAYANADAGELLLEATTDKGTLRRMWTKTKGRVSTKATLNGVDVPAKTNFSDLIGVKIFDITGFWRLTPSQQVDVLCNLADLDPAELDRIDEELDRVNSEKRKKVDLQKEAKEALKDHEKEMQSINESARLDKDLNVSEAEAQLKKLNGRISEINKEIQSGLESSAKSEAMKDRRSSLQKSMMEKAEEKESIQIPSSVESTTSMKAELKELDEHRHQREALVRLHDRMERLRAIPEPVPPAYKEEDIQSLTERIVSAEQGSGIDKSALAGYEAANTIFKAVQRYDFNCEPDRSGVMALIRESCVAYKDAKTASESGNSLEQVSAMRKDLNNMKSHRENYSAKQSEYVMSKKEAREIEEELTKLAVPHYDEEHHSRLRNKVASLDQDAASLRLSQEKSDRLGKEIESCLAELESIEKALSVGAESCDVKALEEERKDLEDLLLPLQTSLKCQIEYNKVQELADDREEKISELAKQVSFLKDEESTLQKQKSDLLGKIEAYLERRCGQVIYPCQVSIQLPETKKKTDRIKFFRHEPNGTKVERGTLSGAQEVEFDLALGTALVDGKDGVVCSEVAELKAHRVKKMAETLVKLSHEDEAFPQQIMMGHSLEELKGLALQFIDVDTHESTNNF